jgi:hypothetical protein
MAFSRDLLPLLNFDWRYPEMRELFSKHEFDNKHLLKAPDSLYFVYLFIAKAGVSSNLTRCLSI